MAAAAAKPIQITACGACGQPHDLFVTMYSEGTMAPPINGKTPVGYFMCPATSELVYVTVEGVSDESPRD